MSVPDGAGLEEQMPLRDDLVRQLDERLGDEQAKGRLPTLVAGIVRDGGIAWWGARGSTASAGGGSPTISTQYRIGSVTKTFVAVSVLRLRDEGVLDLSDTVGQHLPELAELPVTVGQLLSHTSGLPAETPGPWWERTPGISFSELVLSSLQRDSLLWRPGRRFHYSNPGYAILGELVARVRSAPFGEVVRNELLGPLGMRRTTLRPEAPYARGLAVHPHADLVMYEPEHDAVALAPAGQLWSTIEDLARWSQVLVGGRPDVLDPGSVSEMAEPIALMDMPGQPWSGAYGLGLQVWNHGGARRYGHSGAMPGYWAMLLVDQATKDVVVALANSTYKGFRLAFFDELLSLVVSQQPRERLPFQPSPGGADDRAMELVGPWYWGPVEYRLNLRHDGSLELQGVPDGRDCTFRPSDDGSYLGECGYFDGERLVARRLSDGSLKHLDIASFVFTRAPYDRAAGIPGGVDEKGWHAE
jgi:CubicO group peptidase (beta-lactamase class C family)